MAGNFLTMNVNLTPKLEEMVRQKVASGLYNSASEVIREALRLLEEQDRLRALRFEELRDQIRQGIDELDRGEGLVWDKKAFLQEAQARMEAGKQQGS
jgi:antitoxin ParD1/3/4